MSLGNQVEKPRFFIDLLQYQYEIGNVGTIAQANWGGFEKHPYILGLSPTRFFESDPNPAGTYQYFKVGFDYPISIPPNKDIFIAVLGHDWATKGYSIKLIFDRGGDPPNSFLDDDDAVNSADTQDTNEIDIVNKECSYDGWSIYTITPDYTDSITGIKVQINDMDVGDTFKLGGLAMGFVYEPEFHADLAVTQSRIMDGVKNKQTKGGHTYSVINHLRPPDWWTGSPFELTDPELIEPGIAFSNARLGRRSWDVGFSQLSDRFYSSGVPNGVFPANEMINVHSPDTVNGNYSSDEDYDSEAEPNVFNYNINTDTSLYSTVYHHTLGGTLPFLFSPSQDNSPQNFAICRFDKPGFKVTQKSYNKFNIKMKINESW